MDYRVNYNVKVHCFRYMYFWHSNFVRNIFAVVGSSMQEFPPSPDNPTHGSDFLDLRSVASHSVITVTLLSLRLVCFLFF